MGRLAGSSFKDEGGFLYQFFPKHYSARLDILFVRCYQVNGGLCLCKNLSRRQPQGSYTAGTTIVAASSVVYQIQNDKNRAVHTFRRKVQAKNSQRLDAGEWIQFLLQDQV